MKKIASVLLGFAIIGLLGGCHCISKYEPSIYSEPSFAITPAEFLPTVAIPSDGKAGADRTVTNAEVLPTLVTLRINSTGSAPVELAQVGFMDHSRKFLTKENLEKASSETYYVVVLLNDSLKRGVTEKSQRDQLAGILLTASNHNSDVWLSRVFNNKTMAETFKGIMNDLLVGTGAITAGSSAGVTTGLNVSSIVFSKTLENVDKNFFANQSYQAMELVIRARRQELIGKISTKLRTASIEEYTMAQVLSDIQELDETASMKAGLRELQRKAGADAAAAVAIAPSISVQLADKTVTLGGNVTLGITAAGTGPLTYTWYHAGEKLADVGGDSLSLHNLQTADLGAYSVLVSSPYGNVLSAVAHLTVAPPPVPAAPAPAAEAASTSAAAKP